MADSSCVRVLRPRSSLDPNATAMQPFAQSAERRYFHTRAISEGGERMTKSPLYGGIEGGGTKFVCALASSPDRIVERATFQTADPASTLGECVRFFASAQQRHGSIAA